MKNKNGSILVLAIIMVVVLLIIGLALITLGSNARIQAIRSQLAIEAKTAADAGLTKAIKMLRWDNSTLHAETDIVVPGSDPIAKYSYTVTGNLNTGWDIASTGTVGTVQRTVHCKLVRTPIPAIAVQNEVWIQKSDFPCGTFTMQTNSTDENAIKLKAGVIFNGDIAVGPGGNPEEVVDTKASTEIKGFSYAAEELVPFLPVTVPPPNWTVGKTAYVFGSDPNISGDRHYGNMDITGVQNITGPTRIFVEGDMTMFNGAGAKELIVKPGASLELYVNGKLETKNSGVLDNETGVATNFKIFGTTSCTQIDLKAKSASLYCTIYAPSANVTLFNNATFAGSVAADSFTMNMGGSFCPPDQNSLGWTLDPARGSWWEE